MKALVVPAILNIPLPSFLQVEQLATEESFIRQATISPHWLPYSSSFWYRHELLTSKFTFVFVSPSKGIRRTAFNHKTLANLLFDHTGSNINPDNLPFAWIDLSPDGFWVWSRFERKMWQHGPEDKLEAWEGDLNEDKGKLGP